jgi:hypothetical protein
LQTSIFNLLKQEFWTWNHRFDEVVDLFGFIKNPDEACVCKTVSGSEIVFLVLYVDDIFLIGRNVSFMKKGERLFEK